MRNNANIYPATIYSTGNSQILPGSEYFNGEAITETTPDTIVMDTKEIAPGVLDGTYNIGFFYDSNSATDNGTPLFRFELYEDGVLLDEDTSDHVYGTVFQFDLNYLEHIHKYGLYVNFRLDVNKTHQLIVKTSDDLQHDAILDYVIFEKVAGNSVVNGNPIAPRMAKRNITTSGYHYLGGPDNLEDFGTQLVFEQIMGAVGGGISAGSEYELGWTYNTPFKTIIGAYPNIIDANNQLICNWSDWWPNYSQVQIKIKNISSSTWSKAISDTSAWNYLNMRILVAGYI